MKAVFVLKVLSALILLVVSFIFYGSHSSTNELNEYRIEKGCIYIDYNNFHQSSLSKKLDRPFVIVGGASKWQAINKWTIEDLVRKYGNNMFVINVINKITLNTTSLYNSLSFKRMTLVDFLREMMFSHVAKTDTMYYLNEQKFYLTPEGQLPSDNVTQLTEELKDDYEFPRFVRGTTLGESHFWLGPDGVSSLIHRDNAENVMGVIKGSKIFYIWDKDEYLYPNPKDPAWSELLIWKEDPDLKRFPLLKEASKPIECYVHSGDQIFLPAMWWHQVYGMGDPINLAVNFWFRPLRSHKDAPK